MGDLYEVDPGVIYSGESDDGGGGGGDPVPMPPHNQTRKLELISSALNRPIPFAYGRHIVGGNVIFQNANNIPYETLTPDDTVVYFIALGEGEWDGLEALWINGKEYFGPTITMLDTTQIHFHPGLDGELGTESDPSTRNQRVCSFFPDNFRPRLNFSRLAYLVLRLPPDPEAPDGVMDVRGVYRTRKVRIFDGSGTQTAFEYSANPSWCTLDALIERAVKPYSLIGEELTAGEKARINFTSFAAAAAICAGDPGDGLALFESHVAFTDSTDLMRALDQMLMLCRGYLIDRNGEFSLYIDAARSSSFTANRHNIADSPRATFPRKDLRNLANKFNLTYRSLISGDSDPTKDFQFSTPEFENHEHQDAIGRIIPADFDIGNSTPGRAARIGNYLKDRSLLCVGQFEGTLLQCGDGTNPIDLLPGDLFTGPEDVDAWAGHVYEILEITDEPDGSRAISGQSYSADVYHSTLTERIEIYPPTPEALPANPSGASGLSFETNLDDENIPPGHMVAIFNRETAHYETITGVALVLNECTEEGPFYGQGPYEYERTNIPTSVIETGSCTVVKGNQDIVVTRAADPDVVGRVLLIFNSDADLDGDIIESQAANALRVKPAFNKGGGFDYAIVKRWWDPDDSSNALYRWFPIEQLGNPESEVWRTPPIPYPVGQFYATLYSRNIYGVGTRLTYGPIVFEDVTNPLDTVLPGAPSELTVTTPAGRSTGLFLITWIPPATGALSLDDYCIQYDTQADFLSGDAHIFGAGHWGTYDQVVDPGKIYYFRVAAHNKSKIASNGVVKALLDAIGYAATAQGWGPFCSYIGPRTALMILDYATRQVRKQDLGYGIVENSNLTGNARGQHGIYLETFEEVPDIRYVQQYGVQSIAAGIGQVGGKAFKSTGYCWWVDNTNIPYDKSKLLRMRVRIGRQVGGTTGTIYVGLLGYAADGVTRVDIAGDDTDTGAQWVCVSAATPPTDTWVEYTGWIKGWSASPTQGPSTDPTAPRPMHSNVRYIRPVVILNYDAGTENSYIDEISIDVQDEDGLTRSYKGFTSAGIVQTEVPDARLTTGAQSAISRATAGLTTEGAVAIEVPEARLTTNVQGAVSRAVAGLNSSGDVARAVKTTICGSISTADSPNERVVITNDGLFYYDGTNTLIWSLDNGIVYSYYQIAYATLVMAQNGGTVTVIDSDKCFVGAGGVSSTGDIKTTGVVKVDTVQVVGSQGLAVADATDAASVILRLNDLLARCRAHGLIAT